MQFFGAKPKLDRRWWLETKDLDKAVMDNYRMVRDQGHNKPERYQAFMSIYMNRRITSESTMEFVQSLGHAFYADNYRAKYNITQHLIDVVYNTIAKNKFRGKVLPKRGNDSLSTKAKLLEKWTDYQIKSTDLARVAPLAVMDALLFGTGFLKAYREGKKIHVERIYPGEVYVDAVEAAYDSVRQMFQRKYIPKEIVEYQFVDVPLAKGEIGKSEAKKRREAIYAAETSYAHDDMVDSNRIISNPVEVVEAWHLPSGEGAEDGMHVITIDGAVLYSGTWDRMDFPIKALRWKRTPRGFFGIGLAESLYDCHCDINSILDKIDYIHKINPSPIVMLERNSQIKKGKIRGIPGLQLEYTGTPPQFHVFDGVPVEMRNHLQDRISTAWSIAGVDRQPDGSTLPGSFQTGAAVNSYADLERKKYATFMQDYQAMYMDVLYDFVRLGKEIYEEYPDYTVVASYDANTIQDVPWSKLDMELDCYSIQMLPVTALSDSASQRIEEATNLANLGLPLEDVFSLIDIPDTARYLDKATSASRSIDQAIETILDEGKAVPLSPQVDAQLAMHRATTELTLAEMRNVPEERLTLLRNYLRQATAIVAEQEAMAQQRAMGGQPITSPDGPLPVDMAGQNPQAV